MTIMVVGTLAALVACGGDDDGPVEPMGPDGAAGAVSSGGSAGGAAGGSGEEYDCSACKVTSCDNGEPRCDSGRVTACGPCVPEEGAWCTGRDTAFVLHGSEQCVPR